MTENAPRLLRARAKTWSSLGNLGRKPTEYEIVTHNMNHTYGGENAPLEMGPDVHGNVWLRAHRDQRLFGVTDWDGFRDPDELTYRKYCLLQDEQETYVDGLLRDFTQTKKADAALSDGALQFLQLAMTPCRYLGHGEQMLSAYIQQLAPSSYVANCASFQTADTLRRVQRLAYRTRQLDNAHPLRSFGSERETWERDADWQPIRKAIELLLVEYDFDRAFVGFQLVVKPIADNLFLNQFAQVAHSLGAEIDALIAANLYLDTMRANRWSLALARYVQRQNPDSRSALRRLVAEQSELGEAVMSAGARLLARHATPATAEIYSVRDDRGWFGRGRTTGIAEAIQSRMRSDWTAFIGEAGLGTDA